MHPRQQAPGRTRRQNGPRLIPVKGTTIAEDVNPSRMRSASVEHGSGHQFDVAIQDKSHPITRGMSDFKQWDELYHNLIHMHGVAYHVLASAYSSPESRGTGKHEPMMVTTQFGQGRVFHMVLGQVWPGDPNAHPTHSMRAFENPPFQRALLRGCEWAATGDVKD